MPLYEYACKPQGHRFEVRHGVNETPVSTCPECGGEVRRVIQPVGIVFKGSGFYATDSRRSTTASKPGEPAATSDGGGDGAKPSSGDGARTDTGSTPSPSAKAGSSES